MKKNKQLNTEINPDLKITTNILFRDRHLIDQLDDQKLIIIQKKYWLSRLILAAYHGFLVWINLLVLYHTPPISNIWNILELFFWCGLLFITLIFLINDFISKDSVFILNRIDNTITMKAKMINWRNKTITFPFNKARFTFLGIVSNMMIIIPPNSFFFTPFISTGFEKDQKRCLSFFTWYMDKNRPLPPDPRLDPYRQKDYQRRKAEGFPPPLYPSTIPTPDTYIPIKW